MKLIMENWNNFVNAEEMGTITTIGMGDPLEDRDSRPRITLTQGKLGFLFDANSIKRPEGKQSEGTPSMNPDEIAAKLKEGGLVSGPGAIKGRDDIYLASDSKFIRGDQKDFDGLADSICERLSQTYDLTFKGAMASSFKTRKCRS